MRGDRAPVALDRLVAGTRHLMLVRALELVARVVDPSELVHESSPSNSTPASRRAGGDRWLPLCWAAMWTRALVALTTAALLAGCAGPARITYQNVTPDNPATISATVTRPSGPGPFPAVV